VRRDCNVDAYLDTLYKHIDSALSSIGAAVGGVPSNVEDAMALSGEDGLAANVGEGVTLCGGGGRELEEGGGRGDVSRNERCGSSRRRRRRTFGRRKRTFGVCQEAEGRRNCMRLALLCSIC